MEEKNLQNIIEAALLATNEVLSVEKIQSLFVEEPLPTTAEIKSAIAGMNAHYEGRTFFVKEVASGYTMQIHQEYAPYVARLWEERPSRYTRAFLETLVIIAYRQPVTRADIEDIRGVAVSTNIMKTLLEREWIKVVGHRDVPGKPSIYGTTKTFLDYFNLKSLSELPTLQEIKDLDKLASHLDEELQLVLSADEAMEPDQAELDSIKVSVSGDEVIIETDVLEQNRDQAFEEDAVVDEKPVEVVSE